MNVPEISTFNTLTLAGLNLEDRTGPMTEVTTQNGLDVFNFDRLRHLDPDTEPEATASDVTGSSGSTQQISNATSTESVHDVFQRLTLQFRDRALALAQNPTEQGWKETRFAYHLMVRAIPPDQDRTRWQNQVRVSPIFEAYHTRHIPTDTAIDGSHTNILISQFVQLESESKYKLLNFDFPKDYERLAFACAAVHDINDWDGGMWHLFHEMRRSRKVQEERQACQKQIQ